MTDKAVPTSGLKYAWIEFGDTRDGSAFAAGLRSLKWKSVVSDFHIESDNWGKRRKDSLHPLLPIRWRGNALMILPNDRRERDGKIINDPIFQAYVEEFGENLFAEMIDVQNAVLSKWIFCPGVRVSSDESTLTVEPDATDYADLVSISGHGSAGMIFGGGSGVYPGHFLARYGAPPTHSKRLKYVIIATCYNLNKRAVRMWLPALRRKNPVHGFLGYGLSYPGGEVGKTFLEKFAANLKRKRKTMTILDAWRNAHRGYHRHCWAALIHEDSRNDTMKEWLAGTLTTPNEGDKIIWYCEGNYHKGGEVVTEKPPDYTANFYMIPSMATEKKATKIVFPDNDDPQVGLFSGEEGFLEIVNKKGSFAAKETVTIVFYYFRPEKSGMNLKTLLDFGQNEQGVLETSDGVLTLKEDLNKEDKTTHTDGLQFTFTRNGLSKVNLQYKVLANAHENYPRYGTYIYGVFWLKVIRSGSSEGIDDYLDFAVLRGPRPKPEP